MLLLVRSYCLLRCKSSLKSILRLVECYSVPVLLHMIRLLYRFKRGVICFVSLSFAKLGSVYAENIFQSLFCFGAGLRSIICLAIAQVFIPQLSGVLCRLFIFSSSCLASSVGSCSGVCLLLLAAL